MHGLINRAVQAFVVDSYGQGIWDQIVRRSDLGITGFEPMLIYDDHVTPTLIEATCAVLCRPAPDVMEDLGTYLVSHPNTEAVRRLMRFGGVTFTDFLHSLDDLPDRARLAVPNLDLPWIEVRDEADGTYCLYCEDRLPGFGHVLVGILRTMADDYGALALLEHSDGEGATERIAVTVIESDFSEGRSFSLAARAS